jgi:hypothetical protein
MTKYAGRFRNAAPGQNQATRCQACDLQESTPRDNAPLILGHSFTNHNEGEAVRCRRTD